MSIIHEQGEQIDQLLVENEELRAKLAALAEAGRLGGWVAEVVRLNQGENKIRAFPCAAPTIRQIRALLAAVEAAEREVTP